MYVEVYPTAQALGDVENKIVIVIDVLRATSVITTALNNGAKKVIPVVTMEEAFQLKKNLQHNAILGGERKAIKPLGFDMGNSPLEYNRERVYGKTVILTTSNGTLAIKSCQKAKYIFIGCFLNARAVAREAVSRSQVLDENADVVLLCAGTLGKFSLDDIVCAGLICDYICKFYQESELSDLAIAARILYQNKADNIGSLISMAKHYKVLKELGFEEDIDYCLQQDIFDIVPIYDKAISAIRL